MRRAFFLGATLMLKLATENSFSAIELSGEIEEFWAEIPKERAASSS